VSAPVFLDLDGPILDVSPRYHALYSELAAEAGLEVWDRATYWDAKRHRVSEADIYRRCGAGDARADRLAERRRELIETRSFLKLDRPWPWAPAALERMAAQRTLVLVTQRNHEDLVAWQLERYDLRDFFVAVVVGRGDDTREAKRGLLEARGYGVGDDAVFVGDTEVDVCSGKALGAYTVAVRSGIRADEFLLGCEPDELVDDLAAVAELLSEAYVRR